MAGRNLIDDNSNSSEPHFNLIDMQCASSTFDIYIRIANEKNVEGKTFKVKNSDGKTIKVSNTEWGMVWNYIDDNNYNLIRLKGGNTMLYDVLDERYITVDVISVKNGKSNTINTVTCKKNVDLYGGYNVIRVLFDGNTTSVLVGNKDLDMVAKIDGVEYGYSFKAGYWTGAASKIKVERFVTNVNPIKESQLATKWTKSDLDRYFSGADLDDLEGYWTYLDRNLDEKKLKLGGKYTLAIVKNTKNGYDVIYVEGAKVNPTKWECGMLKAVLKPTKFMNNYDMEWYDAVMDEFNDDTYASVDGNMVLTFRFPIGNGQIRFAKK